MVEIDSGYKDSIKDTFDYTDLTFSGSTTSPVFDCGGGTIVGLLPDSAFSGSQLKAQFSKDGENFFNSKNSAGDLLVFYAEAEVHTALTAADLLGFKFIRFVSDASETCTVSVITRKVA